MEKDAAPARGKIPSKGLFSSMRETLDANGIPDESDQFDALDIDPDTFVPIIHLYFSDDLSVA